MIEDIYLIDDKGQDYIKVNECFKNEKDKYLFKTVKTENLEQELKLLPSIVIIDEDSIKCDLFCILDKINNVEDIKATPKIVISSNPSKSYKTEVLKKGILQYMRKPIEPEQFASTIKNLSKILMLNRGISPLTGLPGNSQIEKEIKKRLANNEDFTIIYADLDNFKAYNDVYGFAKGDEVIKFTAKVLIDNILKIEGINTDYFVGHIGGDDFVCVIPKLANYDFLQNIVNQFDDEIQTYFTKDDIELGYLEVPNRRGIIEKFPITSISLAIVEVEKGRFKNALEIGEIGAQVKHQAKEIPGSSIVINRRKS